MTRANVVPIAKVEPAKTDVVAKSYEPTDWERRAVVAYQERTRTRPPCPMFEVARTTQVDGSSACEVRIDHADEMTSYASQLEALKASNFAFYGGIASIKAAHGELLKRSWSTIGSIAD